MPTTHADGGLRLRAGPHHCPRVAPCSATSPAPRAFAQWHVTPVSIRNGPRAVSLPSRLHSAFLWWPHATPAEVLGQAQLSSAQVSSEVSWNHGPREARRPTWCWRSNICAVLPHGWTRG